jgi:hypothetical protein
MKREEEGEREGGGTHEKGGGRREGREAGLMRREEEGGSRNSLVGMAATSIVFCNHLGRVSQKGGEGEGQRAKGNEDEGKGNEDEGRTQGPPSAIQKLIFFQVYKFRRIYELRTPKFKCTGNNLQINSDSRIPP